MRMAPSHFHMKQKKSRTKITFQLFYFQPDTFWCIHLGCLPFTQTTRPNVVGEWSPTTACEQTLQGGAGKGRRTCNYFSGIWISASKKLMRNADWWRWQQHHSPWHVFLNVCLHLRSFPRCLDWRKSDISVDGELQGNWIWNSNSRDVFASSPSFSRPALSGELAHRLPPEKGNRLRRAQTLHPPPSKPTFSEVFQMECRDPLDFQLECLVMPCKW